MKGLLCACLLASLQSMTVAQAYEADIHFSTTYVLARAASPYLVRADGTYQLVRDGDFDVPLPGIHAEGIAALIPNYNTHEVKVQLSHWSQLLALPLLAQVTLLSADSNRKPR